VKISTGLISNAIDQLDAFRYVAGHVDRILRGAKPADVPIEMVSKFSLVLNMKAARERGLSIPQALLLRGDRVVE
jgi:putative ABC transport system substrate-binding protein